MRSRITPVIRALTLALALALSVTSVLAAQRADSAVAGARAADARSTTRRALLDSIPKPPISTRRAFVTSLLVPGLGQSKLGRHNAAGVFVFVEAVALTMLRESVQQVRIARRWQADSVVVAYTNESGGTSIVREPGEYPSGRLAARKSQVEDWIAVLIANHLFSGADAFVAANLWDVRTQVGTYRTADGRGFGLQLRRAR